MAQLRPATPEDLPVMVRIRAESVRELAVGHYAPAVIDDWARPDVPLQQARLHERLTSGVEVFVVAEDAFRIVGFGSLVPALWEVGRLNVDPRWARRGIGSAMLGWIEDAARARGVGHLELNASLNAETFYRANDYRVLESRTCLLPSGRRMPCLRMGKLLTVPAVAP